ncbi:hypothetical protein [uncultured Thalassospira sp.]|uniref:hypothetical protein n=1 Tax=uncultured Thalassospira sp. TaxID=404382 RepID=UPI002589B680|nr:hypothetical protein [uncultured Thalassospira sp.]
MPNDVQMLPIKYLSPEDDLILPIYGYTATQGPPNITAEEDFQATPTNLYLLGDNTSAMIKRQTVNPVYYSAPNLRETSGCKTTRWDNRTAWFPNQDQKPNYITFDLNLPSQVAVLLEFNCTAENLAYGAIEVALEVNGVNVWSYKDNSQGNEFSVVVRPSLLQKGANTLKFTNRFPTIFGLFSLTASTVAVKAEYYWQSICQGVLQSGGSESQTISTIHGNNSTTSETRQFSESLGVSATLHDIGLSLSGSLSTADSHSVTISEQVTVSRKVDMTCPSDCSSVTFQIWELCVKFTAGDYHLSVIPTSEHGGTYAQRSYNTKKKK